MLSEKICKSDVKSAENAHCLLSILKMHPQQGFPFPPAGGFLRPCGASGGWRPYYLTNYQITVILRPCGASGGWRQGSKGYSP